MKISSLFFSKCITLYNLIVSDNFVSDDYKTVINQTIATYDDYGFIVRDPNLFKHHHYDDMVKFLKDLNYVYPNITKLHSIGKSVQGRDLYVLIISDTPDKHTPGKLMPCLIMNNLYSFLLQESLNLNMLPICMGTK